MAHRRDQTKLSLCDLPFELLSNILAHLVPSNQLVFVRTRYLSDVQPAYAFQYERDVHATRHSDMRGLPLFAQSPVLSLLLAHRVIYRLVVPQLYADNTLWFPDLYTLQYFARRFSSRARLAVRKMRLSPCGFMQEPRHCCRTRLYRRKRHAGVEITDALNMFPGLSELVLVGVGPKRGPVHYDDDDEDDDLQLQAPPGLEHHTPGTRLSVWPLNCIALVARIVGAYKRQAKETSHGDSANGGSGPLTGGQVSYSDIWFYGNRCDTSRIMETRIARQHGQIDLRDVEEELIDVDATFQLARRVEKSKQDSV